MPDSINLPSVRLVESAPLRYLLSLPGCPALLAGALPLLCFLHGYDEGAPMQIRKALTRHGPLMSGVPRITDRFIIVAPQLPVRGDLWHLHAGAVREIVEQLRAQYRADPGRAFLTGFSFGANGVFDLALQQSGFWTALWPVDPTRAPQADPGCPVWFSSGEISRTRAQVFIERLALRPLARDAEPGDRVYVDQDEDHVGTARLAYRDDRIYRWLLSRE